MSEGKLELPMPNGHWVLLTVDDDLLDLLLSDDKNLRDAGRRAYLVEADAGLDDMLADARERRSNV